MSEAARERVSHVVVNQRGWKLMEEQAPNWLKFAILHGYSPAMLSYLKIESIVVHT